MRSGLFDCPFGPAAFVGPRSRKSPTAPTMRSGGTMKRAFVGVTLLFAAPVLGGCPMYGSSSSSGGYGTCNNGYGCYEEDATAPNSCNTSADCGPGYECDGSYQCLW